MRIVKIIPHPYFRITLFSYNSRYQLKVEDGFYEEHMKFREGEIGPEQETRLITALESWDFNSYKLRFESLHRDRLAILQSVLSA